VKVFSDASRHASEVKAITSGTLAELKAKFQPQQTTDKSSTANMLSNRKAFRLVPINETTMKYINDAKLAMQRGKREIMVVFISQGNSRYQLFVISCIS
jgi:hypothetical protein